MCKSSFSVTTKKKTGYYATHDLNSGVSLGLVEPRFFFRGLGVCMLLYATHQWMVYVRCKVAYLSVSGDDLIIRGRLLDLIKNRSVFSITIRIRVCITYWKVSQVAHCIYIYNIRQDPVQRQTHIRFKHFKWFFDLFNSWTIFILTLLGVVFYRSAQIQVRELFQRKTVDLLIINKGILIYSTSTCTKIGLLVVQIRSRIVLLLSRACSLGSLCSSANKD